MTALSRCYSVFLRRVHRRGVEVMVSSQKKTISPSRFTTGLLPSGSEAAPRLRRMAAIFSPTSGRTASVLVRLRQKREECGKFDAHGLGNGTDILWGRIPQTPLDTGKVNHMDAAQRATPS